MSRPRPALGAILARRIAFFAVLAMLLQLANVFSDYYWNVGELSRLLVEQETDRLASGITVAAGSVSYNLPDNVKDRYRTEETGYVARIRDANGGLVFESCDSACQDHFLPRDVNPPDFWMRSIRPGKPLSLVGGRAFTIGDRRFLIDIATINDTDDLMSEVLWREVLEHMVVPMSILLVLVLGGTLFSVRQALRPVRAAAEAADRVDPLDSRSHLDPTGMPREIAHLATAVNQAFERVGELMASQKMLTSGIAHEIRTPLAALKLELGQIDHPRARKAEADLDDLVRFVAQLTALARLDSVDHGMFEDVELVAMASSVVEQLAPWVYDNNHTLEFISRVTSNHITGAPALLRDALRNLIENAVRHTPDRSVISVIVGERSIAVEDRYPSLKISLPFVSRSHDGLGIGLRIVGGIAELHGASLIRSQSPSGQTFEIKFLEPNVAAG